MSKKTKLDPKALLAKLKKSERKFSAHFSFAITLVVLLAFIYVIWHIKLLVTAEPSEEAQAAALRTTKFPKIDQKAIDQIQSLEQNSPKVHSLFNDARNNPFNE